MSYTNIRIYTYINKPFYIPRFCRYYCLLHIFLGYDILYLTIVCIDLSLSIFITDIYLKVFVNKCL